VRQAALWRARSALFANPVPKRTNQGQTLIQSTVVGRKTPHKTRLQA